ncbi:hypothetical protein, partial [Alcanivorax jadensis]|uniref:hypothetical protein n=1 Tax=Alcanivorax jadensis TaxID=64988 RepID=UPI002409ECEF
TKTFSFVEPLNGTFHCRHYPNPENNDFSTVKACVAEKRNLDLWTAGRVIRIKQRNVVLDSSVIF